MTDAFVFDPIRTPFGRYGGALAGVRPDDLAAHVVRELVARADGLDVERIDSLVFGNANGAGEDNRCVARMAGLLTGLPVTLPGTTINRLCGSGLDAAMAGSREVETGDADLVLVGGVESMSRSPWVVPKSDRPFPAGNLTGFSTALGWRMVNPLMPSEWTVSLGEATEQLRERHDIPRGRQDEFSVASHLRAHAAWEAGHYDDWVLPVPGTDLTRDESIRPTSSVEALSTLKTAFRGDGTVTAGNSSPLTDGAAACWIGSGYAAGLLGTEPLARIAGRGASAIEPQYFGYGPVEATARAMRRAGIDWDDIAAVELNEAFAAQSLACLDAWPVDPERVNAWGGAIAIGHPLGASGVRVLGTLARRLAASGERWGVASICIGVGQGLAVVLENVEAR